MSLLDAIGNTPLIRLKDINIKLEYLNPSGSVKDRIAKYIIEKAERTSQIKPGYTVIEATSGNTGIAFSMVCALKGYKMVAVMPRGLSSERVAMMRAFGAKVIFVEDNCFTCAIKRTEELGKKPKTFLPKQFANHLNVEEHEKNLGQEILKQVKKVDAFVAGVGTGGTLIGVGRALSKEFQDVKLFAIEPDECAMLASSGIGKVYDRAKVHSICRRHRIEGIGDGIIPSIISKHKGMIDGIIEIRSKDALEMSGKLAKQGYLVGPSSGANLLGALKLRKKYENVVTLFPDRGERYLSEHIF